MQALLSVYGNRVMGLEYPKFANGGMEWTPYSTNLKPCDFFLWGFFKDEYYLQHPETIEELKDTIKDVVQSINEATIQRNYTRKKIVY